MRAPILAAAFLAAAAAAMSGARAQPATQADATLVQRGAYLARAADCVACHTAPGGQPFAGGLKLTTPLGTIVSTNITPSHQAGIGDYSEAEFARALRQGVRRDGANLYPVMPYTEYSGITDADIAALYAYFHGAVKPVDVAPPRTSLPFPFNIRMSLAAWNLLFLPSHRFTPDAAHDAEWNRGAYLANALEHCGTCHTPRNVMMAETQSRAFGGSSLGVWYAPNITSSASGIGHWTADDIAAYLRTGLSPANAQAGGEMREAIDHSLRFLTDADLHAIAVYVKSVEPVADAEPSAVPATKPLPDPLFAGHETDPSKMDGGELFQAYCATCHQASGQGHGGLPALQGNAALRDPNADNVAASILQGIWPEPRDMQAMPAFAATLNDDQIAALTNAVMEDDGRSSVRITAERVAELRRGGATSPLLTIARVAIGAGAVLVILAIMALVAFRRRRTS